LIILITKCDEYIVMGISLMIEFMGIKVTCENPIFNFEILFPRFENKGLILVENLRSWSKFLKGQILELGWALGIKF